MNLPEWFETIPVPDGPWVLVLPTTMDDGNLAQLDIVHQAIRTWTEPMEHRPLIVFVEKRDDVAGLPVDEMAAYGWVRADQTAVLVEAARHVAEQSVDAFGDLAADAPHDMGLAELILAVQPFGERERVTLESCICGEHFDCPDGWHTGDDLPCSCTADCALSAEEDEFPDYPCPKDPDGVHSIGCGCGH